MSLPTKILAALCLVSLAWLAQFLLALPDVERAVVPAYLAGSAEPAQSRAGLIFPVSAALGILLVPIALALRARRP